MRRIKYLTIEEDVELLREMISRYSRGKLRAALLLKFINSVLDDYPAATRAVLAAQIERMLTVPISALAPSGSIGRQVEARRKS